MVAIAGPPGAGKSTLAAHLCESVKNSGKRCCVVPMDGFHLDNRVLNELGLLSRKGSPQSFDIPGFIHTIKRIHSLKEDVVVPVFNRDADVAVAGARRVMRNDSVVLVEGNYLLSAEHPWSDLYDLFDMKIFINPGIDEVEKRILERWDIAQLDHAEIQQRTYGNDLPNAEYVLSHSNVRDAIPFNSIID